MRSGDAVAVPHAQVPQALQQEREVGRKKEGREEGREGGMVLALRAQANGIEVCGNKASHLQALGFREVVHFCTSFRIRTRCEHPN